MAGHLFVVHTDLRTLRCDHWLLPIDRGCSASRSWNRSRAWRRIRRHLPDAIPAGQRVVEVPWTGPGRPWPTNVASGSRTPSMWLAESVREFLERAAAADATLPKRERPLLALPIVGTGFGGKRLFTGDVLRTVLPTIADVQARHEVDVVLVTWTEEDLAAAQAARRHLLADRGLTPFDDALSEPLRQRAQHLARRASQGRLAVFIGAGVSASAGLPTWPELLAQLAIRAGFDDEDREGLARLGPLDQAELIARRFGQGPDALGPHVRDCLDIGDQVGLGHALLAGLPVSEFITTNYDDCFERACDAIGRPVARLPYAPARQARRWLLKMHGCVSTPEDIVLTRQHYVRYAERNAALAGIVQAMLITRHMLFVGFSLDDDNFHRIVDAVRRALAGSERDRLGTVVSLFPNALIEQLWGDDLMWFSLADPVATVAEGSRRFEIFLDYLSFLAATPHHLLNPRFDAVLSPGEAELRSVLDPVRAWMARHPPPAPDDPVATAYARVYALLADLGSGTR